MLADLQVHTPLDPRFQPSPEPRDPQARRELAEAYLAKAAERGVELVGITEHDDVSWLDELRAAAAKVGLKLLPGFEVETGDGVHVLCLFDPATPANYLQAVLWNLGVRPERGMEDRPAGARPPEPWEEEDVTMPAFRTLLRRIQNHYGGICVAAHIDSDKGLLEVLSGEVRVRAWRTPDLLAAQIATPPEKSRHRQRRIIRGEAGGYERERLPAYVLTSDSRSLASIGKPSTWIKLDTVGPHGLRQAFVDPGSRIAYEDPARLRRGPRLLAAGFHGGQLGGLRIGLNPQLNVLIGRTGVGKSAVLEAIRYALGLDYATGRCRKAAEVLLGATLGRDGSATVAVEAGSPPQRYLIVRPVGGAPVVHDADGAPRDDLAPSDLIRPRVYGQHELQAIGANARAQFALLDSLAGWAGVEGASGGEGEGGDRGAESGGAGAEGGDDRGGDDRGDAGDRAEGDAAADGEPLEDALAAGEPARRVVVERLNDDLAGAIRIELGVGPADITISLNVARPGERRDYQPLDRLTLGQRATAILTIVLHTAGDGAGMLAIDQPEEGLDRRTVCDLLTPRLRELKRCEQLIVATQDANLPLTADAEQIVALETTHRTPGRRVATTIRAQGALEREDVRAAAEEILEGGADEYSLRRVKYGR